MPSSSSFSWKRPLLAEGRRVVPDDVGQAAVCGAVGKGRVAAVGEELRHRPVVPGRESRVAGAAAGLVDVAAADALDRVGIEVRLHVDDVQHRVLVVDLLRAARRSRSTRGSCRRVSRGSGPGWCRSTISGRCSGPMIAIDSCHSCRRLSAM